MTGRQGDWVCAWIQERHTQRSQQHTPLPCVCWSATSTVPFGATLLCSRMNSCVEGMLGVDSSTRPMCWVERCCKTVVVSSQLC